MTGPRPVLVADDTRLAQTIQAYLKQALGSSALHCRLDSLREHLSPQEQGVILLALTPEQSIETQQWIAQELCLQHFSPPIVLQESANGSHTSPETKHLHLGGWLRWPEDHAKLIPAIRERLFSLSHSHTEDSVSNRLRRRLLSFTPSLIPMLERISLAAVHDVTVLLTGETGTGKTHLARLMHDCSPRHGEPFITVPCGAQPANLVESVFFGHVKGAFTGADRTKVGKFAVVGKGTLLLDEIDTLGMEAQASLLRVIETGEYEPVGSNEVHHCQARIIVASNWDLEASTRQGRFRSDLYYRLNVMSFHLPPLRERVQDIGPLARAMAARFNTKFRKGLFEIAPEVLVCLENFDWPGNIRQLENVIQQAVLISKGSILRIEDLPPPLRQHGPTALPAVVPTKALEVSRQKAERDLIERALQNNNYNRSQTAKSLGISRVTLYKKMKNYGLDAPPRQSPFTALIKP